MVGIAAERLNNDGVEFWGERRQLPPVVVTMQTSIREDNCDRQDQIES